VEKGVRASELNYERLPMCDDSLKAAGLDWLHLVAAMHLLPVLSPVLWRRHSTGERREFLDLGAQTGSDVGFDFSYFGFICIDFGLQFELFGSPFGIFLLPLPQNSEVDIAGACAFIAGGWSAGLDAVLGSSPCN